MSLAEQEQPETIQATAIRLAELTLELMRHPDAPLGWRWAEARAYAAALSALLNTK